MNAHDEKRCEHLRAYLSGKGRVRWRGFAQGAPWASEVGSLANKLRRGCTFDDESHASGHVEYRGRKLLFEVGDDALIVTKTGETMEPRGAGRLRGLAALEQKKRAEHRAINTELHRKRFGR